MHAKKVLKTWTRREFIWLKNRFPPRVSRKTQNGEVSKVWRHRWPGGAAKEKSACIHNNIGRYYFMWRYFRGGREPLKRCGMYGEREKQSVRLINSREDLGWSLFIRYRRCCTNGGECVGSVKTAKLNAVLIFFLRGREGWGRWFYGCRTRRVRVGL